MDDPKFTFQQRQEIFLFTRMSTLALKPPSLLLKVYQGSLQKCSSRTWSWPLTSI